MDQPLAIHAKCHTATPCIFAGNDFFIQITIENKAAGPIGFPLALRQKTGPVIRLIDRHSKAETNLRTNLADPALADRFTTIEPGHTVLVDWVIAPSVIEQFGTREVDLAAEITIFCKIKVKGTLQDFRASDTLHIVGKRTA